MVATIAVDELRALLERGAPVTVLDVRTVSERAEWAIPGSLHVDAYEALRRNDPAALANVALPPGAPIVTVCARGKTSRLAAERLVGRGLPARSLEGGMRAWSLAWNTADVPLAADTRVLQVRRTGKGCLSYLVGCDREAAVIDPSLDPMLYLELARAREWRITTVLDTHVHADHLSRARALAELAGATLVLPAQDRVAFRCTPVRDGDTLRLGRATFAVLQTPGHTMESACYLLGGRVLFTGDTLFLDAVGRPDLEADAVQARARAGALYRSLQRILTLPEATLILPAHVSVPVPFDGRALVATLAQVRSRVALLSEPEARFVAAVLARLPAAPPNHHRIVELNEAGLLPDDDLTELEAGANRCGVA